MDNPKTQLTRSEDTTRRLPTGYRPSGARETSKQAGVTPEERHHLIAQRAYFLAEKRGFSPGSELEDWLKAEAEVESMLRKRAERHSIV